MPDHDTNRAHVASLLHAVAAGESGAVARLYADDATWRGSHPLNEMQGHDAIEGVWADLRQALPDIERRDLLTVGGTYKGREMVATMGHYVGRWERPWLDMPASGGVLALRYGEVHELENGRIVRSSCLWDVLDAMRHCGPMGAGFNPIAPSYGTEMQWMAPFTGDGLATDRSAEEGAASLRQTLAMHDTLAEYGDSGREAAELGRQSLIDMPQREHWHPKMMWYGPAGIGTGRGLAGFVDAHQLPFRLAFPNRQGGGQLLDGDELSADGGGHYVRLGEGPYSVTGGWPSVQATHGTRESVSDLFGAGPTGRKVGMRVMDFYLHHEGLIRENWVPLDVPHLLLQMGVDVFARMRAQVGADRLGLARD